MLTRTYSINTTHVRGVIW